MHNEISRDVGGSVVQTRDVHGSVVFGGINYGVDAAMAPGRVSVAVPLGRLDHEVHGRRELVAVVCTAVRSAEGQVVVLHGAGGYGKTTIALRVAADVRGEVMVWWVDATSDASLTEGLREVALQAGAHPEAVRQAWSGHTSAPDLLWRTLAEAGCPWLLILDNADDPRLLAAGGQRTSDGTGWLRTPRPGGTVLVTSREGDQRTWGRTASIYPVAPLGRREAAAALLELAPGAGTAHDAEALAARLGGLPLALRLAGTYLASTLSAPDLPGLNQPRSFTGYLAALDERFVELTSLSGTGHDREPLSRTWELSLDLLAERGQPLARPLLRLLSCFAQAPIPYFLLDAAVLAGSPLFAGLTAQQLAGLLAALRNLGLTEPAAMAGPIGVQNASVDGLRLHPVVRHANRHHDDMAKQRESYAWLCHALLDAATIELDGRDPATWSRWYALLPHCGQPDGWPTSSTEDDDLTAAAIQHRAGDFCRKAGLYPLAGDLYGQALELRQRSMGPEHPDTLTTRRELARVVRRRGLLDHAEAEFRDILAIQQRVLGPEHRSTLTTRDNLAYVMWMRGELDYAEAEVRDIIAAQQRVLGPEHRDTITSRSNLAFLRLEQGQLDGTETEFRDILAVWQRLFGPDHPDALTFRFHLARVLRLRGQLDSAETEYRDILAVERRVFGHTHPFTLNTRHHLADLMWERGQIDDAEAELRDVLTLRQQILGPEHPDTEATRQALTELLTARKQATT